MGNHRIGDDKKMKSKVDDDFVNIGDLIDWAVRGKHLEKEMRKEIKECEKSIPSEFSSEVMKQVLTRILEKKIEF